MAYQDPNIPVLKFCGATVLSFNSTLGVGATESSMSVDLIEDCEDGDSFFADVGAPAHFQAGDFSFSGIITNLTKTQGRSGKTINVKMSDPRQLLQNCIIIIDSYLGEPIYAPNYFNVYAYYESTVINGDCSFFGTSLSDERGMPYKKIVDALSNMNPVISSPTDYDFYIDFDSLRNSGVDQLPEFYRVPGPSITILELLQNICDALGLDFYVNLDDNVISFSFIDLRDPSPDSFAAITNSYNGKATDISYGQELRNEHTKTVIFGEKVHYLAGVSIFDFYFGEEEYNGIMYPIYPIGYDVCGFWINKKITNLNITLDKPLPNNGPYTISELDIRCAMASYKAWTDRTFSSETPGTFNEAIRKNWPESINTNAAMLKNGEEAANGLGATAAAANRSTTDRAQNPAKDKTTLSLPSIDRDLNKIWSFIKNLGDTFYGKQFICPLNETICVHLTNNYGEKIFSSLPTNAGGWVEPGYPILGLKEPELSFFRTEDDRLGGFAFFNAVPTPSGSGNQESTQNYGDKPENKDSNYVAGGGTT